MSDDDSDLTDIDELDDEEYNPRPSTSRSKAKTKVDSGDNYRVRGALRAPRAASYSAQTLYDQIHSGDIDLEPEYQRDVVWPDSKQIGLVDSLFRNFFIPPVIFAVKYSDDGSEHRVCIDGKQRLTSIWRFMDGLIPYVDAYTNERFVYKESSELKIKAKMLPEKYKKIFAAKQIICMEYVDLSHDSEREIFQRVQLGMALTPAEKLQALNGPAAAFTRELLAQYGTSLGENTDWDTTRGSGFRGFAFSVYCMIQWPELKTMPSITLIQKWLQGPEEPDEGFCEEVHTIYQIFVKLSEDSKYNKIFKASKRLAPVEFMAVSLLIYTHKNRLTLSQMAEAIQKMRKDVRTTEVDIRMNGRILKPMLQYIQDLTPSRLKADAGQPVAAKAIGGSKKRKARQDDDTPAVEKKQRTAAIKSDSRPSTPSSSSSRFAAKTAKPPPAPQSNVSTAPPPSTPAPVKVEASVPTVPPIQVPDRLSGVRAAKERLASGSPRPPDPSPLRTVVPQPLPSGTMPERIRSQPGSPMVPQFPGPSQQSSRMDLGDSLMSRMGAPTGNTVPHSLQQAQLQQQSHPNGSSQAPYHQPAAMQQQHSAQQAPTQHQQQTHTNGLAPVQTNGPSSYHSSHQSSRSPVLSTHNLPPRPVHPSLSYERDQRTIAAPLRSPTERYPYRERDGRPYEARRDQDVRRASWSAREPDHGGYSRNRDWR
ncbi:hypothetical protein CERSUDRAFT_96229 [Gelatoporia subvermispora B]|uniref:GmrSD restriction endonucleases N-terminal domain-containing protein n=1 Tax=Ceriporiopsis subvermispora (strain B) TaxID=914234 RepID=M2RB51_CERS8|nr:hypothetical protein CERSUDRAFT_96229 [Gelatoporia subvermispora B]